MDFIKLLHEEKIVPVVAIESPERAPGLARALLEGGISLIEVTFRTERAADAIAAIHREVPEMHLCAGTVLTPEQAEQALAAGAEAIVSPGTSPRVVEFCQSGSVPVLPGCATPTEVEACLSMGLTNLKFFPAEAMGGVAVLKALSGPYGGVKFMPTGGIGCKNLKEYLALPNVLACGSSWIAPKNLIEAGEFAAVTERAKQIKVLTESEETI